MVHYALTYQGKSVPDAVEAAKQLYNAIEGYANACVAEVLQPRELDPELASAEKWLRSQQEQRCDIVAAGLDRLRAEVARLKGELADAQDAEASRQKALDAADARLIERAKGTGKP
jgi:peptidoglycan hydrolase CwlO-like protein